MVKINPAADTLKHIHPNAGIFQYVGTAEIIKFFNAVFFNLFAAGNAKLFFGRHFSREAVAVPPQTAFDFFAVHGLETGDNVFHI